MTVDFDVALTCSDNCVSLLCSQTIFDLTSILDSYEIDLGSESKSYSLVALDDVSKRYGSKDGQTFCGARNFELEGNPEWVSVQGNQLTLTSISDMDAIFEVTDMIGTFEATLSVSTADAQSSKTVEFTL